MDIVTVPVPPDIDKIVARAVAGRDAIGGTLTVAHGGHTRDCVTGITSTISRIPVDRNTLFRLESLTKLITTTVVLQLRDVGVIELDDPAVTHLPGSSARAGFEAVTIRHLLSHQSGLPDLPAAFHVVSTETIQTATARLIELPLLFTPGENLSYSGAGFVILGAVIEHATGLSWETAVREAVLKPLGLRNTCLNPHEALAHRTAVGHAHRLPGHLADVVTDPVPAGLGPAAGAFGSAGDLLRLALVYARGGTDAPPVISEPSRVDASRGQRLLVSGFAPAIEQGLGWQVARWGGRTLLMHHSFGRGYCGHVLVDADRGEGFSILVNSDTGEKVCIDMSRLLLDALCGVVIPKFDEPSSRMCRSSRYVGRYVHDDQRQFSVKVDDAGAMSLQVTSAHQMAPGEELTSPIRALDERRFSRGGGYILFGEFDAAGHPHTVHVENQLARRASAD